jgi:hypothetical protein
MQDPRSAIQSPTLRPFAQSPSFHDGAPGSRWSSSSARSWVDLDAKAAAAGALGGEDRRAAAAKGIEHRIAPLRRIEQGVRDESDRLDGRMQVETSGRSMCGSRTRLYGGIQASGVRSTG